MEERGRVRMASRSQPTGEWSAHRGVRRGVAQRRLQLLQLGPQVLPRGLPGHAGDARRDATRPTAFHANVVAMEQGPPDDRGRRRGLRPLHAVRRLRAALPEHALHRRLLPLPHAHGRPGQGDARARRRAGHPPAGAGSAGTELTDALGTSPCSADVGSQDHVRRLGDRPRPSRSAARRSSSATARPRSTAPRSRAPSRRCCRRPASSSASCASSGAAAGRPREMGYVDAGTALRRAQRRRLARRRREAHPRASTRTTTSRSPRTTRATSATTTTSRSCSSSSSSPS